MIHPVRGSDVLNVLIRFRVNCLGTNDGIARLKPMFKTVFDQRLRWLGEMTVIKINSCVTRQRREILNEISSASFS